MSPTEKNSATKSNKDSAKSSENESSSEKSVVSIVSTLNRIERVVVHPLVLLSVVDHYNRMGKVGNSQRVVGVLLGSLTNKTLDVSNSFARKEMIVLNQHFVIEYFLIFSSVRRRRKGERRLVS